MRGFAISLSVAIALGFATLMYMASGPRMSVLYALLAALVVASAVAVSRWIKGGE
ncbi:MAG: hypothetical protein Q7S02_02645 [bacterium]|nr:hypothetical protein [bacterium]